MKNSYQNIFRNSLSIVRRVYKNLGFLLLKSFKITSLTLLDLKGYRGEDGGPLGRLEACAK